MLFVVFLIILITGLIFRKSKLLFILQLLFIFILFAGVTDCADYQIYYSKYYYIDSYGSYSEWLFTLFIKFCNSLNMSYEVWRGFVALIYIFIIGMISYKLSPKNHNFIISLLMVFPLCMDAIQLRQTLAMLLGVIGLYILYNNKSKKDLLLSLILIAFAGGIHVSAYLYLILIPCFYIKSLKKILIYGIVVFLAFAVINMEIFSSIANFFLSDEKIDVIITVASKHSTLNVLSRQISAIIIFSIYSIPYIYYKYLRKNALTVKQDNIFKINIVILLIVLPLINLDVDFYRLQQIILIFSYYGLSTFFVDNLNYNYDGIVFDKKNILLGNFSVLLTLAVFYLLVYQYSNYESCFLPLFNNNFFF